MSGLVIIGLVVLLLGFVAVFGSGSKSGGTSGNLSDSSEE